MWESEAPGVEDASVGLTSTMITLDALTEDSRVQLHGKSYWRSQTQAIWTFGWSNIAFIWKPSQKQKRNVKEAGKQIICGCEHLLGIFYASFEEDIVFLAS